jgi:hypothetical protein
MAAAAADQRARRCPAAPAATPGATQHQSEENQAVYTATATSWPDVVACLLHRDVVQACGATCCAAVSVIGLTASACQGLWLSLTMYDYG